MCFLIFQQIHRTVCTHYSRGFRGLRRQWCCHSRYFRGCSIRNQVTLTTTVVFFWLNVSSTKYHYIHHHLFVGRVEKQSISEVIANLALQIDRHAVSRFQRIQKRNIIWKEGPPSKVFWWCRYVWGRYWYRWPKKRIPLTPDEKPEQTTHIWWTCREPLPCLQLNRYCFGGVF